MASQDDFIRTALRVPPALHAKIHEAAKAAGRTFNAEIVYQLERAYGRSGFATEISAEDFEALKDEINKSMFDLWLAKQRKDAEN